MADYLKYPVLFVHGMGFRDRKLFCYWGRTPKAFEARGCRVFFAGQNSSDTVEANAAVVARRIDEIIALTGAEKVNIIAHSKGGLEARYAISKLGKGKFVASLTTLSTPHHGSKTVDLLQFVPDFLVRLCCKCCDIGFWVVGDKKPDTYGSISIFRTAAAAEFNRQVMDDPAVYYQSYAFIMKRPTSDMLMCPHNIFVKLIEGDNDGLLPPASVKWGNFRGVFTGNSNRGISHCDEVDLRRFRLTKKQGDGISDIVEFYLGIADELKQMGF